MTVEPDKDSINDYVKQLHQEVLTEDSELWILGRMVEHIKHETLSPKTKIYQSISELVNNL
jgi:hypothetical protein